MARTITLTSRHGGGLIAFMACNIITIVDHRTDPATTSDKGWQYTSITTTDGDTYGVKETLNEILDLINLE